MDTCAITIALLSLCLTGCSFVRTTLGTGSASPSPVGSTNGSQEVSIASASLEKPSEPGQNLPQAAQRASETRLSPSPASKGAEQLFSPNIAGLGRPNEKTTGLTQPTQPAQPTQSTPPVQIAQTTRSTPPPVTTSPAPKHAVATGGAVPAAVATPGVKELIFKGPPRKARTHGVGAKWMIWAGLGACVAALVFAARFFAGRRVQTSALSRGRSDELIIPRELLLKEPANSPPGPLMTDNP